MKPLALLLLLVHVLRAQSPLAHLRFEAASEPSPPSSSVDVPGRFIYDPLTRRSFPNRNSAAFVKKNALIQFPVDFSQARNASITIEAFVMPASSNRDAVIATKTRLNRDAAELGIEINTADSPVQGIPFHGATFACPENQPFRWTAGEDGSLSKITAASQDWRHLAVVYDPVAKSATCYVYYHIVRKAPVPSPLSWDSGPLLIGRDFIGLLDEVRITKGALSPGQFLRARADSIQDVSFTSTQQVFPRDAGCLDLREHFGAVGDGKTDDTPAFSRAFRALAPKSRHSHATLIVPAGIYLVSDTLKCDDNVDLIGSGAETTVIRLKSKTFTDPHSPKPLLRMSSTRRDPTSSRAREESNQVYLSNLTLDTGDSNPGAKGLEYHCTSMGRIEKIIVRSGSPSGDGVVGIDLTYPANGPALIQRVNVIGFDYAFLSSGESSSFTLEHVAFSHQKKAGIRSDDDVLTLRGIVSDNRVPAIVSDHPGSALVLLESILSNPDRNASALPLDDASDSAIRIRGGCYCRRIQTSGYKYAVERFLDPDNPAPDHLPGPFLAEYVGDSAPPGFGAQKGSLKLPIEETPNPPVPNPSTWTNIQTFADKKIGTDWGPALQAAVDSGATVIYFPYGETYAFDSAVHLHSPLQRLVGLGNSLHWKNPQGTPTKTPPPLLIYDEQASRNLLVLDRIQCDHVQHASPGTLILRSSDVHTYSTASAGGTLFLEDVNGAEWHFDHSQSVWARQWHIDGAIDGPSVQINAATLWVLGFKTEASNQKFSCDNGARLELLGGLVCPSGPIPPERTFIESRRSALSAIYSTHSLTSRYSTHIRDSKPGDSKIIRTDQLKWIGSRGRFGLYTSDGR